MCGVGSDGGRSLESITGLGRAGPPIAGAAVRRGGGQRRLRAVRRAEEGSWLRPGPGRGGLALLRPKMTGEHARRVRSAAAGVILVLRMLHVLHAYFAWFGTYVLRLCGITSGLET